MEALDLLTTPQVSTHFKQLETVCSEVRIAYPDLCIEPVAVLALTQERKLDLSDPVIAVKRDGQLVCLWSQRTAKEKIESRESFSTSASPVTRKSQSEDSPTVRRIPSLSSIASGVRVNRASLSAALLDLREENARLKTEMANLRDERSGDLNEKSADELQSLRRRLLSVEQRVSIERSVLANRMRNLDEREEKIRKKELSMSRHDRLVQLTQSIAVSPGATSQSQPASSPNNVQRRSPRRGPHAWR